MGILRMQIGFTLSSEEFGPKPLAKFGYRAEQYGFKFLMISDHYHPWVDKQGHSPFVWNVIGALSETVKSIPIGTGVTGSILRLHPAVLAQAAATSQVQLEGRFLLGVGTGENLNEHVVGYGWPPIDTRREMLTEMIEIIRQLWTGGYQSYKGQYYEVEDAKIYTMPEKTIPILYSALGPKSASVGGTIADGFVTTSPDKQLVKIFQSQSKKKKPIYGQMSMVYETTKKKAKRILKTQWPLAGLPGQLNSELRLPLYFQNTAELIDYSDLSSKYILGNDKDAVLEMLAKYKSSGFTHVYIHNIGPHQNECIKWLSKRILPSMSD